MVGGEDVPNLGRKLPRVLSSKVKNWSAGFVSQLSGQNNFFCKYLRSKSYPSKMEGCPKLIWKHFVLLQAGEDYEPESLVFVFAAKW